MRGNVERQGPTGATAASPLTPARDAGRRAAGELPEKDHPARAVIEAYKTAKREHIAGLCRDAGFAAPERLADGLFLLLEGARINLQSVGRHGPGSRFLEMAQALIAAQPRAPRRPAGEHKARPRPPA